MAFDASFLKEIKKHSSKIFRRLYIKRRTAVQGLFETEWLEITEDVKKWGVITSQADIAQAGKYQFSSFALTMANDKGRYSDTDNKNSLWRGFASRQRTLIKIETGFRSSTISAAGIRTNVEYPQKSIWDDSLFDASYDWDADSTTFIGLLWGNVKLDGKDQARLPIVPLTEVFRQYPARRVSGFTTTGITASKFMETVRDHTDGSGNFVFRPFFGDSVDNWVIGTTTQLYPRITTSTVNELIDQNVWTAIEKFSLAENFVPYVSPSGVFNFTNKDVETTTALFAFHGAGSYDRTYGHTIKEIQEYTPKLTDYYSRVQLKWSADDTTTSYITKESAFFVSGSNEAWNNGFRTYSFELSWFNTSTVADVVATQVFNNLADVRNEVKFTSSFVPTLDIRNRISITYDTEAVNIDNLWDINLWAEQGLVGTVDMASNATGGASAAGSAAGGTWRGQRFIPTLSGDISQINFSLRQTGAVTGTAVIRLYEDDGAGKPGVLIDTSNPYDVSGLTGSFASVAFTFSTPVNVSSANTYHAIVDVTDVTFSSNLIQWEGSVADPYADGGLVFTSDSGANWTVLTGTDLVFTVYGEAVTGRSLIWDDVGQSFRFSEEQFNLTSISLDLEKLETKITARSI